MSEGALAAVREACNELTPLPDYLHDALLRYFRSYVAVGGMPEVVQRFYDGGGDFATVYELQVELVKSYKNDISKYAGKRALDVQAIFDQLPLQLDSDSRRFVLNSIDDDARYERYRQDFVWLVNAGVGLKTDLVREPKSPLAATARAGHFKLYESDTGMLVARYGRDVARAVYLDAPHSKLGALFGNVVARELAAQGSPLFYYMNKKRGEVDFVTSAAGGEVLPIEVKSGTQRAGPCGAQPPAPESRVRGPAGHRAVAPQRGARRKGGLPALVRELLPAAVHAAEGHPAGGRPAEDLGLPLRMRLPVKGRRGSWTGLRLS